MAPQERQALEQALSELKSARALMVLGGLPPVHQSRVQERLELAQLPKCCFLQSFRLLGV